MCDHLSHRHPCAQARSGVHPRTSLAFPILACWTLPDCTGPVSDFIRARDDGREGRRTIAHMSILVFSWRSLEWVRKADMGV